MTFVLILLAGSPQFSASFRQYFINMTMLSAFIGVPAIDGVYWTLYLELRFYVLVALVLAFGAINRAERLVAMWLVISWGLVIWPNRLLEYLLIVDYSAYFIAGATFFLVYSKGITSARLIILVGALGLAVSQGMHRANTYSFEYQTEYDPELVASIISAIFILMWLVAVQKTGFLRHFDWAAVGGLTYPLYLLHQNVGFIAFNNGKAILDAHLLFWGTVAVMLSIAYLVNMLTERSLAPVFRRHLNSAIDRVLAP